MTSCIVSLEDRPVGYVQFYPWNAEAETAAEMGVPAIEGSFGLDIFIGEPDVIDRGVGSRVVALLARHLFETLDATTIALLTPVANSRAHRAYEKAGFRKVKQTFDTDIVNGERRMSWLMVLERPLA
jgi:aminoglycoside 6'-N-acetyltransferase